MNNAWSTYRQPLYLLTDDRYSAKGCISIEPDGRYLVRDTTGTVLNDRKTGDSAIRAAEKRGLTVVSSAWYGVQ